MTLMFSTTGGLGDTGEKIIWLDQCKKLYSDLFSTLALHVGFIMAH